ncbi:MAG: NADH dehydrogenase FAD-containing subunit, partial [Desulfovibrio sp.]|nr:NADH dehydrogenase FAD-containing subunit [Desulfovibrio sp.]
AVFIIDQGHYKRLLAYSSIEHMGILALGVGLSGGALFGALLHAVCHSLTKCMLFLLSGNILARYHTYSSYDVRGMRWTMPFTGTLWTAGFLAVAGSPPFGVFVSELLIFKGLLAADAPWSAAAYLTLLAMIFVGLSVAVLRMVQGNRPIDMPKSPREPLSSVLPPLVLGLAVLTLGLWVPAPLWNFLSRAAALIGG